MDIKWNEIDLSLVTTHFSCLFNAEELQLIDLWKDRVAEFMADESLCKTPRQRHFFGVLTGKLTSETPFEILWLKVICIYSKLSDNIDIKNELRNCKIENNNLLKNIHQINERLSAAYESEKSSQKQYSSIQNELSELIRKISNHPPAKPGALEDSR